MWLPSEKIYVTSLVGSFRDVIFFIQMYSYYYNQYNYDRCKNYVVKK